MKRFSRKNIAWISLIVVSYLIIEMLVKSGVINPYYEITLKTIMVNIIYATGLNLVLGVAGQFSLGHAGFIAVGAYSAAIIMKMYAPGLPGLFLGMIVGALLAGLLALVVGLPTLRLKGDYLAIATLGVSEIVRIIINNADITGGPAGLSGITKDASWQLVYWAMVICTIIVVNYTYSSTGRATMAVNQNEIAAQAMGVNITKQKVIAFVIGAMTAAVGGALQASFLGVVTPGEYTFDRSIDVLIIVVFGGIGSYTGSYLAAIVLGLLNLFLQDYGQLRMVIYGIALVLIMIFRPGGLLGNWEFKLGSIVDRRFSKKDSASEEAVK